MRVTRKHRPRSRAPATARGSYNERVESPSSRDDGNFGAPSVSRCSVFPIRTRTRTHTSKFLLPFIPSLYPLPVIPSFHPILFPSPSCFRSHAIFLFSPPYLAPPAPYLTRSFSFFPLLVSLSNRPTPVYFGLRLSPLYTRIPTSCNLGWISCARLYLGSFHPYPPFLYIPLGISATLPLTRCPRPRLLLAKEYQPRDDGTSWKNHRYR